MARGKKSKVFNLFKSEFKITFYHKPTMINDDNYHVIILDDSVRLIIRMIENTLIVDDVMPMTSAYISNTYDRIVETFIKQKDVTVLVSITGNIAVLESSCIKVNAPIVEDERYNSIPKRLYDELKSFYKEDTSKYGFYLLAVNETPQEASSISTEPQKNVNQKQKNITSTIEFLLDRLRKTFDETSVAKENHPVIKTRINYSANINGITMILWIDTQYPHLIGVDDICLSESSSYMDFLDICEVFESFTDKSSIILCSIRDRIVYNTCVAKNYEDVSSQMRNIAQQLFVNQSYFPNYGTFKIIKK